MGLDLESGYKTVGFVIVNRATKRFVGRDDQSGGYPWESDSIQGITLWRTEDDAKRFKAVPGFERHGSADWMVKPLYVRAGYAD